MSSSGFRSKFLSTVLVATICASAVFANQTSVQNACTLLRQNLPGKVFFPGSSEYAADISHYEFSSTQNSTCSVEPTSTDDVVTIVKIVGANDTRAPFAIKSGGHATNVGFSSTLGVQISLSNISDLNYDPVSQTVKMGSGLLWNEIYAQLDQYNVTVAGGRVPGVGMGLALGGGYSWIANQYGLSVDNFVALDIVLPNGTFVEVTNSSQPDLFFGLKGGLNNFGVVTYVNMTARPLSSVWGGVVNYASNNSDSVAQAVSNFSLQNTDPKVQIAAAYVNDAGTAAWQVILSYAAESETQPSAFQPFLDIPSVSVELIKQGPFSDFLTLVDVISTNDKSRGISNMIPILQYTPRIVATIQSQINSTYAEAVAANRSVVSVLLGVEPFYEAFNHSTGPSAYPHSPDRPVTPCNPWVTYADAADDEYFNALLWKMSNAIQAVAIEEGQSAKDDIHYPNYALGNTPLELLYGENLPRLQAIKEKVDPTNVMGLAGGYKF